MSTRRPHVARDVGWLALAQAIESQGGAQRIGGEEARGFVQPLALQERWHIDSSRVNVCGSESVAASKPWISASRVSHTH